MLHPLLQQLGLTIPIVQAPMAGTSTAAMAIAVSNGGGLGSISVGAVGAEAARAMIRDVKAGTDRAFNVNVFCHAPPRRNAETERRWLEALKPTFEQFGASPPQSLHEIYTTFVNDDALLQVFLEERPRVVSFHFGLPSAERIAALHGARVILLATATTVAEAKLAEEAGVDGIVAQGYEAGGHRGMFDPQAEDSRLGTFALVRLLAKTVECPIVAAGGIMDGAGIAAAMSLGAIGAQLGTAFITCPESSADAPFRAALMSEAAHHTTVTRSISGRPARCLANRFTELTSSLPPDVPAYPVAYDAGKALNAAARTRGESGYGAQWAGQGAPLARAMPAAELLNVLHQELRAAMG